MSNPKPSTLPAAIAALALVFAVFATASAHADNLLFQLQSDGSLKVIHSDISSTSYRSLTSGGSCGGVMYVGGTSCIFWDARQTDFSPADNPFGPLAALSISSSLYTYARDGIAAPGSEYPIAALDSAQDFTLEPLFPFGPPVPVVTGLSVSMSFGFAPVITNSCSSGIQFNILDAHSDPTPGCLPWLDDSVHEFVTLKWYDGTVDHIDFQAVPEPQSFALLAGGLLTLSGRTLRRLRSRKA